jgi:DNA mismatch repair protein MutS
MSAEAQLTPMMAQYRRIKSELPKDALLLFRLGDFYEMFFEDAQAGAQLINLALTSRNGIPMCGLPHHAANSYIGRLLKAGRKVAICDQTEEAKPGKLVNREVTQILSPGTHFDERMLVAEKNNFLAAVVSAGKHFGLALVDLTTGDFLTTEVDAKSALLTELERLRPAEIVHPMEATALRDLLRNSGWTVSAYDDWTFAPQTAVFTVQEHFKVASLDGFGLKDRTAAIGAAGGALHYLAQNLRRDVKHLTRLSFYQRTDFLALDYTTLRHLEILEPQHRDAPRNACLYGAMNKTATPMGARLLRNWLSQPLAAVESIRQRQETVARFIESAPGLDTFRAQLAQVRDLERTLGRLSTGSGNARDLVVLRQALEQIPVLRQTLSSPTNSKNPSPGLSATLSPSDGERDGVRGVSLLESLTAQLSECPDLVELIGRAIVDEPPLPVKDGGMIRDGFDTNLDELRNAQRSGKDWLAKLQQDEIERTGITSLKVRFNSVFGYYIEVTKSNLDKVPPHYIRKQTVANGERYITPELKDMEGKILGAEERSVKLEYELFQRVREEILGQLAIIQQTASALAQLDVLACFAEVARLHDYCRPHVADEGVIQTTDGRHPVLEQSLVDERFVPNDTALASVGRADLPVSPDAQQRVPTTSPQIALITGPNMAGKSTYIRQVALLTLLAHTGSFIPAKTARIDLVDRIFTRIGASDDLARGQSTFMVEMSETANILNNATARSLIILDEIGRGTSTFDGLSLAWSIVEHLHNQVGAKTLFATHYHELTELADLLPGIKNVHVSARETSTGIVFLKRVETGSADKSYGIEVARMAGLPPAVIARAREVLERHEQAEHQLSERLTPGSAAPGEVAPEQQALFTPLDRKVLEALREADLDNMKPLDALNLLAEMKKQIL